MWTPKRVLLLLAGFALFFTTYEVYAHFLGGIDGLPPLPEEFWPTEGAVSPPIQPIIRVNDEDRKLAQSFGEDCDEVKRAIKILVSSRGLVLAANDFKIQDDGRVKLWPFSVAIFSKDKGDHRYPEINTVRSDEAYLTFDQPISSPTEMTNRKIVAGELRGSITITNNRRTREKNDDILVTVAGKPLFYKETIHKVWTDGAVKLLDTQCRPNPTEITAMGMELYLTTAPPPQAPARPSKKPRNETVNGVDRVVLRRNVKMHLYVDPGNGFLGSNRDTQGPRAGAGRMTPPPQPASAGKPGKKGKEPDKAHVVIDTDGPFVYDVPHDLARFDVPRDDPGKPMPLDPPQVLVFREHDLPDGKGRQYDQMICDHLELQFRRKAAADRRDASDNRGGDREIESAHATADKARRPDEKDHEIVLVLDSEALEARGQDLFYHCPTSDQGPETTLKGSVTAIKDRNKIECVELWLLGSGQKGSPQKARARGPGKIWLADHDAATARETPHYPYAVTWKDMLTSAKDGVYDLLTLTGDAYFIDYDHDQQLHGERLLVWLEPPEKADGAPRPADDAARPGAGPAEAPRQRPHRLEAYRHVTAHSPDMNITETEHLSVFFHEVKPADGPRLPGAGHAGPGTSAAGRSGSATAAGPAGAANPEKQSPKQPINLRARSVIADVNRVGARNEMQKVLTRGAVHVHQNGSTPDDKGVDIKGETLELLRKVGGDVLVVLGDGRKPAELQMGELFIVGPKVTIDQKENTAEVKGVGHMDMPSNTTFEGNKPARPGTRLKVFWNQGMLFNGRDADFQGGVTANQDKARLQCQSLQVTLDRTVSLKEGQKGGQQAKVEKLVCDRKVHVEDTELDARGKLVKYQRLVCRELAMDNQQGQVNASGPGIVYLLQKGAVDNDLGTPTSGTRPATAKPPAAPKQEMKLTRVEYEGRMMTEDNKAKGTRTAWFWDKVEVVNVPSEKADVVVDKDNLPERGLYMSCEKLTVFSRPGVKDKATQVLTGENKVYVKSQDFQARARKVVFDEATDLIIFYGTPDALATFYRMREKGVEPEEFKGLKIIYNRLTKQYKIEGGGSFQNISG